MNTMQRPTFEDLSRYIDGLVSDQERDWICTWIEKDADIEQEYRLLNSLQDIADSGEPVVEQRFFTDTRASILEQVQKERRRIRPSITSWWLRLLSPQRLLPVTAGVCALLLAFTVLIPSRSHQIAEQDDETLVAQTGADNKIEGTPEQIQEVQETLQFSQMVLTSAVTNVKDRAGTIREGTSGRFTSVRDLIAENGEQIVAAGSERVGDAAETLYNQGQTAGESLSEWTVRQNQINVGTSLLSVALGIV